MADEEENTKQICTKKRKQKRNSKLQSCKVAGCVFKLHHSSIQNLHLPILYAHPPT